MIRTALAFALAFASLGAASALTIGGTLRGPRGEEIPGARVRLTIAEERRDARTDAAGRFAFADLPDAPGVLRFEADGWLAAERRVTPDEAASEISVVLVPARASAEINVTAVRAPRALGETPASVVVLRRDELSVTAAPTADDTLRQAAGFALFRRSGSRTANPTTQGVSLRGVGASGAARAAVLDDGLPLNDPFGGWIFWGRVSPGSLERIEVVRGGASELYGGSALAGVVQLVGREARGAPAGEADLSAGSESSRDATLFTSARTGAFGAVLSAESYTTRGYLPVAPEERGPVDAEASSRHTGARLTLERNGEASRVFLRGNLYEESRGNGTPLQKNDVHLAEVSGGAELNTGGALVSLRGSGTGERFHQSFTSIAVDRSSERLTRFQTVPADAEGLSAQVSAPLGAHLLVAGAEARRAQGESREDVFGAATSSVVAGGRQTTGGAFVEDVLTAGADWTVTAGIRFDAWSNRDGHSIQSSAGSSVPIRFPDRDETAWSPRLSALYHATGALTLTASAYESFRPPTLNELYRSFRVGNAVTEANSELAAERLRGAEAGISVEPAAARWRARANVFWMEVRDAIGNRTLTVTPALVTRRRENIGGTRARGVELDLDVRLGSLTATAGYLFSDSTVTDSPASPSLVGLRVPQVPRHQATLRLAWRARGWSAALQARAGGAQFEDDQNLARLAPFFTADFFLSRSFGGFEPYLALENAFDARVETGRTPATTLGPPRTARLGLRVRLGG